MASDPRLNLLNLSLTVTGNQSLTATAPDSCSSSISQGITGSLSINTAFGNLSLSGSASVGAFQNLAVSGGGQVGAGLRGLVSISDSVRIGGMATATNTYGLPTTSSGGSDFVLNAVGLNSVSVSASAVVNPPVAAAAMTQAAQIYNQVSQGAFTSAMVTANFSAFQNAATLSASLYSPPSTAQFPPSSEFGTLCGAKPYAEDLIRLAPKYKFLFVVQFEFDPDFQQILNTIDPAFVVKNSTRPNIQFEYEDVNFYNFRTKIPRKTIYEPMTMKFYDDDFNNIFQFYTAYLKIVSPIANIDIESQAVDPLDAYQNAGGGMGFESATQTLQPTWGADAVGQGYAATLGPYGTDPAVRNVLRRISIFHVYRQGTMMNVYHFYNPKITTMNLDEVDMASAGEGNEITLTFAYDSVFIIPGYRMNDTAGGYNLSAITSRSGMFPFGIVPGSVPNDGNPKDGFGLVNGEIVEQSNESLTSASFVTMPMTAAGANNMASTLGNTDLSQLTGVTTTASKIPDPVTGTTQDSADNSEGLAVFNAQTQDTLNQQNTSIIPSSTLPGSQSDLEQFQSNVNNANNATSQPSTTFDDNSDNASTYTTIGS